MSKIAILFGTTGGNTENVANKLQTLLAGEVDTYDVSSVSVSDISDYDYYIVGTSTDGMGELQEDWDGFLPDFATLDLSDKKVAIFALGDSASFGASFAGSMRVIYDELNDKTTIVGAVADEGYTYDDSEGVIDGQWVGLPIDEENESDRTDERLAAWVEILKKELV